TDPAEHGQRKSLSDNRLKCARPAMTGGRQRAFLGRRLGDRPAVVGAVEAERGAGRATGSAWVCRPSVRGPHRHAAGPGGLQLHAAPLCADCTLPPSRSASPWAKKKPPWDDRGGFRVSTARFTRPAATPGPSQPKLARAGTRPAWRACWCDGQAVFTPDAL